MLIYAFESLIRKSKQASSSTPAAAADPTAGNTALRCLLDSPRRRIPSCIGVHHMDGPSSDFCEEYQTAKAASKEMTKYRWRLNAGLNVLIRTITENRVSLKENSKNLSIFSFVSGISHGNLTKAFWRWFFAINLPICVVSLIVIFFFLRNELLGAQPIPKLNETEETGRHTKFVAHLNIVDYGGQFLFIVGFGLITLALTWGGATYRWDSAAVIVSLVLGVVFAVTFFA
ncbi:Fungal trichothecene efflux pump (TRI12) [Geosmithia morbida]|uniref:Fungal trichothecene efflux pump (TRI12) n=1 Tax=Geosmithia morbida TaxID=1094350 RepID=A0A9P4YV02_9HYPO|nr:Fungal trichothecene efflux pump (TRI12) [Geosmithia morbida]KAF4123608.1 Fungal trichothecene efflux pump (TRI12) [Geosmithia morbida]